MSYISKEFKRLKERMMRFGLKEEVYLLLSNLSALMGSGVGVIESLETVKGDIRSSRLRRIVEGVIRDVNQGTPLSKSFDNHNLLPPRIYTLMRIGEESGKLLSHLDLIVAQNEKEVVFRSKVRSSLLYALIVSVVALIVMFATALIILPKLADFYSELDTELPFLTKALIEVGSFFATYGYIALPAALSFIIILLYFLFSFPKTKYVGHSLLFHLPILKKLLMYSEVSRFGFLLGSELEAGVPIVKALDDMPTITTFKNYQRLYKNMAHDIQEGKGIYESIKRHDTKQKLIPRHVLSVISAGEKSGSLSKSLLYVGKRYERKVDQVAKNLPTIIEPIIVLFIGLFIAVIALATILPIYSLTETF